MNRWIFSLGALIALVSLGCGSGTRPYAPSGFEGVVATPRPTPTPTGVVDTFPDFSLTAPSVFPAPTLSSGGTLAVALTVRTNAAVGAPIALSLLNPPAGVTATFSPASVAPSSGPVSVTMTLRATDPSKSGSVQVLGKSGTIERTASTSYSGFVAPSGFGISIAPVGGQSNASLTRLFDVTLSQSTGSGGVSLDVDRNDRSGEAGGVIPLELPSGATVTGLPNSATLAAGETGKTFRLTVTLPEGATNFFYGFGVNAQRGGRKEKAALAFFFSGTIGSALEATATTSVVGNTDTVKVTYTPKSPTFSGTVTVDRAADGTLTDSQTGTSLTTLPAGSTVAGLPQTLTFDGTGSPRTLTFTVTAPAGTPSTTYYGIRVRATTSSGDSLTDLVNLLQFGIGGM
jgi:hypothetical protein